MQLFRILEIIKQAPSNQMSHNLMRRCQTFNGSEDELLNLFHEVYVDEQASDAIRNLLDPYISSKTLSN